MEAEITIQVRNNETIAGMTDVLIRLGHYYGDVIFRTTVDPDEVEDVLMNNIGPTIRMAFIKDGQERAQMERERAEAEQERNLAAVDSDPDAA